MKSYIKSAFLALGAVALLASCDENSWNDDLDGFKVPELGTTSTVSYTLTDADYTQIAGYSSAASTEEEKADLAAVGANKAFVNEAQAQKLLALFLANTSNDFFVLNNGSAVNITYKVSGDQNQVVKSINDGTLRYTVTEEDYIAAYGSDENYIDAFSPATPASRSVPSILKAQFPDAQAGQYAVVAYNQASQNPIFGNVGGETPSFEITSALTDLEVGDGVEVTGYVTAIDARGFVLTDNAGSILCYQASGFNTENVSIGDVVSLSAEVSAYNKGLQIAISDGSYTVEGSSKYTYPTPKEYTGAMMDQAITRSYNDFCEYCTFVGTVKVSGNYTNIIIDGAETAQGSPYQMTDAIKAQLTDDAKVRITGYFCSISGGRYFNVVITEVTPVSKSAKTRRAPAAPVPSEVTNNLYVYNGTAWTASTDALVLQATDYTAMDQKYGNLSNNLPAELLPIYLKTKFPYAQADASKIVAYLYYGGGTTEYRADEFVYDGAAWNIYNGEQTVTSQFVKNNNLWNFDPSVTLVLPYARNTDPSYTVYMACVQWVFDNISKPMGGTSLTASSAAEAAPFIDYRGNAEFYSGASAYYGNVDIRATTAKNNAPAGYTGYDGLDDQQITQLMKERFCYEVLPGALKTLYPAAKPVEGIDVKFTISFTAYEDGGVSNEYTVVYVVDAPGSFKFESCDWFTAE